MTVNEALAKIDSKYLPKWDTVHVYTVSQEKISEDRLYTELGRNIKKIREQKELTQIQLSAIVGVSNNCIKAYEKAQKRPSIYAIYHIAHALQVPVEAIFGKYNLNMFKEM